MFVATGRMFVEGPKGGKWDLGMPVGMAGRMDWELDLMAKKQYKLGLRCE